MAEMYGLLVGCNYTGTDYELKGSINDVESMRAQLGRFGFKDKNVTVLTDKPGSLNQPTGNNIRDNLTKLFDGAKSGDVVFLFFSGLGTTIQVESSSSVDQAIVPSDRNVISSTDFDKFLQKAPDGVNFVFVSDSSYSGKLIGAPEQIGPNKPPTSTSRRQVPVTGASQTRKKMIPFERILKQLSDPQAPPNTLAGVQALFQKRFGSGLGLSQDTAEPVKPRQGILLSGSQPDEQALEADFDGVSHGIYTNALITAFKDHPGPFLNDELVIKTRAILQNMISSNCDDQHPCLYCSDDNVKKVFLFQHFWEGARK